VQRLEPGAEGPSERDLAIDPAKIIYLDNATTSFPKPREVMEAMLDAYVRYGVNLGRSGYDLCLMAGDLVAQTRHELMDFFGGTEPNRWVFAANATDALNTAIQGMLADGDHAVSTTIEHNSVIRPLKHLRCDRGVQVAYVPGDSDGRVDPAAIVRQFRSNTKLVVVNHGSNVIGTIQPVAEIAAAARAAIHA
jgi:cysteine desulfurase/selenocysteine lyase